MICVHVRSAASVAHASLEAKHSDPSVQMLQRLVHPPHSSIILIHSAGAGLADNPLQFVSVAPTFEERLPLRTTGQRQPHTHYVAHAFTVRCNLRGARSAQQQALLMQG